MAQDSEDGTFDLVVIGAGAAGEAAAGLALDRGASVALIEDDLVGGSCAYWACIPSKALLHGAAIHRGGGDFPWTRAAAFRDWNINREGLDYPDDGGRARGFAERGATVIRGRARLDGTGTVEVRPKAAGAGPRDPSAEAPLTLSARMGIVIAVGSGTLVPPLAGLDRIAWWSNREATAARELPRSLLVLGGGPTGVELSQVYARYGVPVTIVDSNQRLLSRDHPRSSDAIRAALERDGATVRTGVRATQVEGSARDDGAHRVTMSDGSAVDAHAILVAVGRSYPVTELGLDTIGVAIEGGRPPRPDPTLRIADGVFLVGDPAGPEMHTHLAHYEGEMAARIALGEEVTPDFRAIPRATYTDPETASVGVMVHEAQEEGRSAFEEWADIATSAKGYVSESTGHVSCVFDESDGVLLGAFIAGPGASEAIHEAVLAVKLRTPAHVLADTLHAFPTVARVMGGVFAAAAKRLG